MSEATYTFLDLHTAAEDRVFFEETILHDNEIWVAAKKKEILGYLAIRGDYIDRLYVALESHGEGVGTALLDHAKKRSPTGLRLFTHQKNERACGFYERRGFVAVRYGVSPPPESEPDVEYHWVPHGRHAVQGPKTIHVYLRGEGVPVWRPVEAEACGARTYRITSRKDDPDERWQFQPGDLVRCEERTLSDGPTWVAVERIEKGPLPELVIDGASFRNLKGFYRALEKALGSSTDCSNVEQLNDILRGGFGTPERGFTLVWKNAALSRDRLGRRKTKDGTKERVFDVIVAIFGIHGPGGEEAEDNAHLELQ